MSGKQQNCISDGEEEADECAIDYLANDNNDVAIRKNLLDEFDVPAKQKASSDSANSGREYVKVYLRIRPFSNDEIEAKENQHCLEKENESAVLLTAPKESFAFKNSIRAGGEISHRFSFSSVFDETTTQKTFFDETTLPLVADFIHGQNCLVFTYGVTNSGKTYTIQGTPKDGGILPRALDVVFNSIEGKHYSKLNLKPRFCTDVIRLTDEEEHRENAFKNALLSSLDKDTFDIHALLKLDQDISAEVSKVSCADESALCNTVLKSQEVDNNQELSSIDAEENVSRVVDDTTINVDAQGPVKFSVWVSFAEIYNETIHDLLEPCPMGKGKKRTTLRLGDDTNGNPYVKGLREIYVSNADEAYKILKIGQKNLRIASTRLNQNSSRSHCIFSIKVLRVVDVDDPHVARVSRLSFVDLAGSERYSKTQSKGDRLKEAGNINTSLMTLGKCLDYLRYNQRNPSQPLIIPFRESKLTRLFQGFFCGKGRASMIVNVNMCASMFDETFHVMKFSAIAKKVTTKVTKPVDIPPPPAKKTRPLVPTPRSKAVRLSVPWANGAICTPAPEGDVTGLEEEEVNEDEDVGVEVFENGSDKESVYQQQLVSVVKMLQEKLIEEKRKMQTLEVRIREEVCKEMAEQLVSIENAYSERVKMEVNAVEEKCDRRIELLTQSIKKNRKRTRVERAEEDDEEWVPNVFLHAEQKKVEDKQHVINDLNAKIAELRQEVKQLKDSRREEAADSEVVLELQSHLNAANEEANELKEMLEEAGEVFTEKEAEMSKLRAALDKQEASFKNQDEALKHLTKELEIAKSTAKQRMENAEEIDKLKAALELASSKLSDAEKNLENKESLMKELVRSLEETRDELARERSYVAQAFDNDEELIRIKDELQTAEKKTADLEKDLASKDEAIRQMVEVAKGEDKENSSPFEETKKGGVDELLKELEEVKEEVREAKEELLKTKSECKEKDLLLQEVKKERDEKAYDLENAAKEISNKQVVLEDSKRQIVEMEAELQTVKDDNVKKDFDLEKALEEKLELLARMKTELFSGGDTLEKRKDEEGAREEGRRIKELEEQILFKSTELENSKSESTRKITALEEELAECRADIQKLRENQYAVKELEQQLEESTKALDKKNSQVIARNNTIKKLELSLVEKERQLSEMEKFPKEPNLRAKEELKTLRRRLVQADKEREDNLELLANKDSKLEEANEQLEQLRREGNERVSKALKGLQDASTELEEVRDDAAKKREEIQILREKINSQNSKIVDFQTKLANNEARLLEKQSTVQSLEEELKNAVAKSSSELDEGKKKLSLSEEKVQELEEELWSANQARSRFQADGEKFKNEIVPSLEKKVKDLEEANSSASEKFMEAIGKLELEVNEARSMLGKRNEEFELKVKEVTKLRDFIKTAEQEKSQELDKCYQDMMNMQKTIQERNKSLDDLEQKLRDSELEKQKSEKLAHTLKNELEPLRGQKDSLEEKLKTVTKDLELVTSDSGKEKETLFNMKRVLEEQDDVMANQAQEIDDRQAEIKSLSSELHTWREKCSFAEKELERKKTEIANLKEETLTFCEENKRLDKLSEEIKKLKEDRSILENQLQRKDEELRKTSDSRENIMKTMREALEVAKANKAEYEVKLSTVREQCREEMRREMEEQIRRTKRDFQKQLDDKDRSLKEIKSESENKENTETLKSDSSNSDPDIEQTSQNSPTSAVRSSQKKSLKRNSSDLTLAEVKKNLLSSKKGKLEQSDDDFTPGKLLTRTSARKTGRSSSSRSKRTAPATVKILPNMDEPETENVAENRRFLKDFEENTTAADVTTKSARCCEESENVAPKTSQSTTKKRGRLFRKPSDLTAVLSPAKPGKREDNEQDKARNLISRQLRPRSIKYN
ncbi:kinesin-like protein KIF20B [Montipora capricornis]|uniref:kinesin-like protein KIF20B n=1 Tax=Montipora capricornis TaxID=246305 RepID=UPI0035F19CAF